MEKTHIALLQDMPIFGGLTSETLEFLVGSARIATYAVGEELMSQGDPAGTVLILEYGEAEVIKILKGREYKLCNVTSGDCLGEMSLIDPSPRCASVRATENCCVICLEPSEFYGLRHKDLGQFTVLQLNIARELCRRLRTAEARLFMFLADQGYDITV